jgi:hypothetical protein
MEHAGRRGRRTSQQKSQGTKGQERHTLFSKVDPSQPALWGTGSPLVTMATQRENLVPGHPRWNAPGNWCSSPGVAVLCNTSQVEYTPA